MENPLDNQAYATPRPVGESGESLEAPISSPPVVQPPTGQPAPVVLGGSQQQGSVAYKTAYSTRWALMLGLSAIAIFVLVGLTGYIVSQLHHSTKPLASKSPDNYAVMNLPLSDLAKSGQLQLTQTSQLLINGQLSVNNTLVLEPTAQPAQATAGELYYDQSSNTLRYYNGHAYVSILDSNAKTSFNNKTGNFTVGQGLALNGNQLVNTVTQTQQTPGVTSLQGETGAVSLTSGGGVQISGTTITNSGVTSLGGHGGNIGLGNGLSAVGGTLLNDGVINILSGSSNLSVTHDDSGNYTITESGSGTSGTVSLGPNSPQADTSNNPSISIDKQGGGNLLQLATGVTPTNRFVVDQTGAILTGTISFDQVTGQPNFVNTINGASGALTLGSGLSISGQQLLNAGVTSVSGTTNQVVVNSSTGDVILALPQSIGVASSPIFAGLSLSAPLTVGNGGTGSATAAGARSNLGAAASGANSDITSLSALTVVNPDSSLTIGNDGQTLTLQGSTTSLSSTNGSYTSTLGFATPTTDNTITIPDSSGSICLSSGNCLGPAGSGANIELSNLSSVAINTSLLPGSTGINLGSAANPFDLLYLGDTATDNFEIGGTASAARTITLPDASGTVCLSIGNCLGGEGGANTALSNLNNVAINTSLLSGSSSINLGSAANPFDLLYLGGTATDNFEIEGTASAARTITLPDASGTVCLVELGNCAGSGSGLVGSGATNTLAIFTGNNSLGDSILTEDSGATTITVGGALSVTGDASADSFNGLGLTANSTGFSIAGGATSKTLTVTSNATIDQNLATTASPTFSGLTLSAPLPVGSGGTGANSLTQYGVLIGEGTSSIQSAAAGSSGMCLVSTATAPTWQSCPGAGGVSSVNSQTGAVTIAGVSAGSISTAGGTITINDATGSVKGLASFSSTNFIVSSGAVNTIQDIDSSATPTFNGLSLTNALQPADGGTGINTANPANGQLLIGNGSGYTLNTLTAGAGVNIVNTAGAISISAPASGTCANCASQSLNNLAAVAINTSLLPGTTNAIDLGSGSELFRNEYLAGNLQGNTATFESSTNSQTAFQLQNSGATNLLTADTTNMQVDIGALTAPGTITAMLAPTAPTVTPTGTTGSTSYGYEVTAVSTNGAETLASTAGSTSTGNATLTSSNYNAISWSSVSGASLYKIYRTTGGTTQGLIGSTTSGTTSFNDTGLTAGAATPALASSGSLTASTTYYYKVTALDDTGGETTASSEVSASTTSTYNTITLSWAPVAGARSYKVYRGTSSGAENTYYTTATNSFTDTGATGTTASPPTTSTAYGNNLDNSANATITIGNSGTAVGQLYIGGVVPSGPVGSLSIANGVDAAVQGNYAYVAINGYSPTLDVVDISNPTAPQIVGSASAGSGFATREITVSGQYAYTNVGVYNISNPAAPSLVASLYNIFGNINNGSLLVTGNYVYQVSNGRLTTANISNPANPVETGSINSTVICNAGISCGNITVQNGYLYLPGEDNDSFSIYSLSNPAVPALVSTVSGLSGQADGMTVEGRYAYVDTLSGFEVFDISNLTSPVLVGTLSPVTDQSYLLARGSYVYAGSKIINVSNPSNPTLVGTIGGGNSAIEAINGRYLYAGGSLFTIYDLGGEYTSSLQAGSTETGSLQVDQNEQVAGSSSITGGLTVGGSAQIDGNAGIAGSLTLTGALQGGNNLSTPGAPTVTPTGGTASTSYGYEVAAVSSSGGTTSASAAGTTTTGEPFGSLTSSVYNAISWTAVSGASSYNIYRVTGGSTQGLIGNTTGTSLHDIGLTASGSAPTTDTSGTITENGATTINGQTTIKSATNSTTAFQVQNASGSSILNVDSTNMRMSVDATSGAMSTPSLSTPTLQNSPSAPTITHTGTTGSGHYSYEVTAVTSQGLESVPSSAGSTTTGNAVLSATNYNVVSWSSVTGASSYNIYRTAVSGGSPAALGFVGTATGTSFNDTGLAASGSVPTTTGLTNGTTYYYKITALDAAGGETAASTEKSITTTAAGQGVVLGWSPVTGAASYRIYRGTTSGGEIGYYSTTGIKSGSSLYFIDNGATQNNTTATPPTADTAYTATNTSNNNLQVSVGGNGTPTGQLYVSGTVPSSATGTVATGTAPRSVAVSGNYAYVVNETSNTLQIFDISNPAAPTSVGTVATGSYPQSVAISGRYAYVVNYSSNTLQIFDISNPAAPTSVGTVATDTGPRSVAISGNYAYVVNSSSNTLQIFDISNPANPVSVDGTGTTTGSNPFFVTISGRYAYVANYNSNTLQIFDISNPANPVSVGTVATTASPDSVAISGNYAYVVNYSSDTLQIFDISNPANPVSVGTVATDGSPISVAISGRYAYMASNNSNTLQIFDISNPANPVSVGTVATGTGAESVAVAGRYAYVVNETSNTLQTFDLGGEYTSSLQAGSTETGSLQVDQNEQVAGSSSITGGLTVGGSAQIDGNAGIAGSLTLTGALQGGNNLSTPGAPTVATNGTAGSTSYSYEVVAVSSSGGTTPASAAGSTTTGNATLSATNYNTISWTAVTGASNYYIYRTASGGTPSSTGYIGSATGTSFNDTGIAGTTAAPTTDTSGTITENGATTINGQTTIKSVTNSTTAFQVQDASGTTVMSVDTTTDRVDVGTLGTPNEQLYVSGTAPTYVGENSDSNLAYASSVYVQGNYAYVGTGNPDGKLVVYNISSGTPVYVGENSDSNLSDPNSVYVQGNYAYVTDAGNDRLMVYNISNPTDPTYVAESGSSYLNAPDSVYVQGNYAYVVNNVSAKLVVYNISSGTPVYVGENSDSYLSSARSVYVQGNYAYVTDAGNDKLVVYNISSGTPVYVGENSDSYLSGPESVYVQGNYAYVTSYGNGKLVVYNISSGTPVYVGENSDSNLYEPYSIYVQGNYAYVVSRGTSKLVVYNISSGTPVYVGENSDSYLSGPESVYVQGNYAYVLNDDSSGKLLVYNLGGASIQQLQTGGTQTGTLAVQGNDSIGGNESITGGLSVGGSTNLNGTVGINGQTQISTDSTTALQVQDSSGNNVLTVDTADDYLCINLASCNNALGVAGNIAATGTITGGVGSPDYAEDITASDPTITGGNLVSMDPNNPGQVVKSSTPYDPNLLGAISTHPGFITNAQESEVTGTSSGESDQVPLALAGRIPVDVSTENGDIAVGDYITSSSSAGVGMKATQSGPVIGRAMESYSGSGTGSITVFIEPGYYNPGSTVEIQNGNPVLSSLQVTGDTQLVNLTVSGTTTVQSLTVLGDATFNSPVVTFSNNTRGANVPLDDSATSKTITFSQAYPDADYTVYCTPNFNTTCYVTNKTTTGFTLNFGTPAPGDGSGRVDWLVIN